MRRALSTILVTIIIFALVGISAYLAYYYGYYLPEQERIALIERERLAREREARRKAEAQRNQPLDVSVRRSLAHADAVLLAYFNNRRARANSAGFSLADIGILQIDRLAKFQQVLAAVNNSNSEIGETYFAFYPHRGSSLTPVMALLGDFDKGPIQHALQQLDATETEKVNGVSLTLLHEFDKESCDKNKVMSLYIRNNLIVLGDPELLPRIVRRLSGLNSADYINPDKWQQFNRDKTLSVWLRHPSTNIPRFFPAPFNTYVKQSNMAFRTFVHGFVSFDVSDNSDGHLSLELHGRDINHVVSMEKAWLKILREHSEPMTLEVRVLDKAMNNLRTKTDDKVLQIALAMETKWFEKWADIAKRITRYVNEKLERPLVESTKKQNILRPDRIEKNPPSFRRSVRRLDLRAYDDRLLPDRYPDQNVGPFGFVIDHVQDEGQGVSFDLSVAGTRIPNLGSGLGKAKMVLSGIKDKHNQSLENQAPCGPKRFIAEAEFTRHDTLDLHQAEMTVHLEPGVAVRDVDTIVGNIAVALPAKTSTHPLFLPTLLPYSERIRDLKVTVYSLDNGTIEYSFDGDVSRVLAFRALNAKRQVLSRSDSQRSAVEGTSLFPEASRFTDSYIGRIHSLELVYADAIEHIDYPFTLAGLVVNPDEKPIVMREPELMRVLPEHYQEQAEAFIESNSVALTGPFFLELSGLKNWKSLTGDVRVIAPAALPGVSRNLTTSLRLVSLQLLDGTQVDLLNSEPIEDLVTVTQEKTLLAGRLLFATMEGRRNLLEAIFPFQSKLQLEPLRVKSLQGELAVHLAQSAKKITIPIENMGERIGGEGFSASLVSVSRDGYVLSINEGAKRLLRVVPRNAAGRALAPYYHEVAEKEGVLFISLEAGPVTALDIYFAGQMQTIQYPFTLAYEGEDEL